MQVKLETNGHVINVMNLGVTPDGQPLYWRNRPGKRIASYPVPLPFKTVGASCALLCSLLSDYDGSPEPPTDAEMERIVAKIASRLPPDIWSVAKPPPMPGLSFELNPYFDPEELEVALLRLTAAPYIEDGFLSYQERMQAVMAGITPDQIEALLFTGLYNFLTVAGPDPYADKFRLGDDVDADDDPEEDD